MGSSNCGCGVTKQYSLAEMAGTICRLFIYVPKKRKGKLTIKVRFEVFLFVCIDSTVGLCLVYRRFISDYQQTTMFDCISLPTFVCGF